MKKNIKLRCIGVRGERRKQKKMKKNIEPIKPFILEVVKEENKTN